MEDIKVIVCDDHLLFIDGVVQGLSKDPQIKMIGHALNGEDLLKILRKNKADVIILDIQMPKLNGLETALRIRKQYPKVKIIALSMHDQASMIKQMIKAGAHGYLLKNTTISELSLAIRTVYKGETYFKGSVHNKIVENKKSTGVQNIAELISNRELEILKLVADGLSNNEIADTLYISIHTVHSHRKNMIKKLNLKNTAELLSVAYKNNLI